MWCLWWGSEDFHAKVARGRRLAKEYDHKQIPFEDDRKKGKDKNKCERPPWLMAAFAFLVRMT